MGSRITRIAKRARRWVEIGAGAVLLVAAAAVAAPASAAERGGYIVVDSKTGRVLEQENSETVMHPASLTKMMTLYLAFEALEAKELTAGQMLRVSRHAASMPPSELGLRRGDRISLRDAIRGAAVKSANDAAVVIAEAIAGDEERFARKMTSKARELGMRDTTFKNASGLTKKGHVSTPRDMAILARRLYLDFNDYYWMFSKRSMRIRGQRYRATNTLLGAVPGVDGVKTGYTRMAGHNLAASAERDDERVFVVRMGAPSRSRRDRDVSRLIERGFDRIDVLRRHDRRQEIQVASLPKAPPARMRPGRPGEIASLESGLQRVAATARVSAHGEARPAALAGDWRVQVGAFGSSGSAKALLGRLTQDHPGLLKSALHAVEAVAKPGDAAPSLYRARFSGLDEAAARRVCAALEARGSACALVPPRGWTTASR